MIIYSRASIDRSTLEELRMPLYPTPLSIEVIEELKPSLACGVTVEVDRARESDGERTCG